MKRVSFEVGSLQWLSSHFTTTIYPHVQAWGSHLEGYRRNTFKYFRNLKRKAKGKKIYPMQTSAPKVGRMWMQYNGEDSELWNLKDQGWVSISVILTNHVSWRSSPKLLYSLIYKLRVILVPTTVKLWGNDKDNTKCLRWWPAYSEHLSLSFNIQSLAHFIPQTLQPMLGRN